MNYQLTQKLESPQWHRRIGICFWVIGAGCGIVLALTNRYYINSDAIVYIEMGELFRLGNWWGLVNLTFSPGYPILLAFGQLLLGTTPVNELKWLKVVNVVCLLFAMGACDLFVRLLRRE
jgi:hypothetical protein